MLAIGVDVEVIIDSEVADIANSSGKALTSKKLISAGRTTMRR